MIPVIKRDNLRVCDRRRGNLKVKMDKMASDFISRSSRMMPFINCEQEREGTLLFSFLL